MHADPLDTASEREQEMRDDSVAEVRRRAAADVLPAVGVCHNCLAEVIGDALHCDDDCKRDHAKRRDAEKRAG